MPLTTRPSFMRTDTARGAGAPPPRPPAGAVAAGLADRARSVSTNETMLSSSASGIENAGMPVPGMPGANEIAQRGRRCAARGCAMFTIDGLVPTPVPSLPWHRRTVPRTPTRPGRASARQRWRRQALRRRTRAAPAIARSSRHPIFTEPVRAARVAAASSSSRLEGWKRMRKDRPNLRSRCRKNEAARRVRCGRSRRLQ